MNFTAQLDLLLAETRRACAQQVTDFARRAGHLTVRDARKELVKAILGK
jgi:hypothetical protein